MKKRVLFVLNNMNIGGTEKACLNMLDTLSPDEYDVTLLLLEESGGYMEYIPSHVRVETIDGYHRMKPEIMDPPLRIVKGYMRAGKVVKASCLAVTHLFFKLTGNRTPYYRYVLKDTGHKSGYDVAIAYAGPFDFLSVYVAYHVSAVEKIQWIHFDISKFHFNRDTVKRLYRRFQKIHVVSDEAKTQFLKVMPEMADRTSTYHNVVSAKKCRELAEEGTGFDDDWSGTRVVTIGRLSKEKGQDMVPAVAQRLREAGISFRWYLIGDGNLRPRLEKEIRENGLEDTVILLGTKANPYPYLKQADVYVQTSVHEGFCITLAEAKVFDLPIIATDFAGAHEQLDGRANCCVIKRDAEEMVQAILKVMRM